MAILDHITPAELQPRVDVIKNILNAAITRQEPLSDQKIKAIIAAILDVDEILDKHEEESEDEDLDEDMVKGNLETQIINSPTRTLNLL
jgi:uncharacterized protein YejL (UPF0352 family)